VDYYGQYASTSRLVLFILTVTKSLLGLDGSNVIMRLITTDDIANTKINGQALIK